MGVKVVVGILGLTIGAFALGMIGLLIIGVIANVVTSGDVAVPAATNTSINTLLADANSTVLSIFSPIGVIASLVIIVVLVVIFFRGKLPGMGGSSGKGGVN